MCCFCVVSLLCNVVHSALSSFAIILLRKREPVAYLLYFDYLCSVFLNRGMINCSLVCDCGISMSYSFYFVMIDYMTRMADLLGLLFSL